MFKAIMINTNDIVDLMFQAIASGSEQGSIIAGAITEKIFWALWPLLAGYILITGIAKLLRGRIGSFIYNLIFIIIVIVAVLFNGFEVLFSINFYLIYLVSFIITGIVLALLRRRY